MKRRKLFLSLFLFVSMVLIGVGYSVLSKELKISGRVDGQLNNDNLVVRYVAGAYTSDVVDTTSDAVNVTVTPTITNDLVANIVVSGMNGIGDKAIVYFLIQNDSTNTDALNANLSNPVITITTSSGTATDSNDANNIFQGEHFKVSATYESTNGITATTGSIDTATNTATLNAKTTAEGTGQNVWIKVEIELIDVITVEQFPTHNIQVLFTATTN